MNFLERIKDQEANMQKRIEEKLDNGLALEDHEIECYKLRDEDEEVLGYLNRALDGESIAGFSIKDFLASPQAKVLVPKIVIGAALKAADPVYLASKYYKKIKLKNGATLQFPKFGVIRAYDVQEAQEIPAQNIDWNMYKNSGINVGKVGLRIQYTDDLIQETEMDIVGTMTSEAGRAMARHSEQKAFTEFRKHGYVVFDNELYAKNPAKNKDAATSGTDFEGALNGTMSLEDYLDLCIAVYNNGYTPNETVMHSLAFPAFVKNGLTGALTAVDEKNAKYGNVGSKFTMGPAAIAGKLPFGLNVALSPFAPINRRTRTFDMITVDTNNVGYLVEKMAMKTEGFRDPARDLNNLKMVEKYGYGTKDEGRAVALAKNISMAKSYPRPQRVQVMQGPIE